MLKEKNKTKPKCNFKTTIVHVAYSLFNIPTAGQCHSMHQKSNVCPKNLLQYYSTTATVQITEVLSSWQLYALMARKMENNRNPKCCQMCSKYPTSTLTVVYDMLEATSSRQQFSMSVHGTSLGTLPVHSKWKKETLSIQKLLLKQGWMKDGMDPPVLALRLENRKPDLGSLVHNVGRVRVNGARSVHEILGLLYGK